MRTFTAASSHYIELPNRGSNREFDAAASTNHVTSVRFRSSSTGSRHVVYSAGRGTGTQTNCYIDLNGSVAGQLRVVVYKSAGNSNVLTADNIADGNWHTVSLVRNGTSTWRVFLDGAQVGSDFTRATTSSTSLTRTVGRYFDTGAATAYLTGDIEFVCYHDTLTLEEHTSLHNGTNPFDVGGSCWGFVPFGPSDALHNDDIRTWFDYPLGSYFPGVVHTAGTLPALSASAIDKPWGMGPTGVNIGTANLLSMRTKDLIANGSGGDTDVEIREFGNIFARSDGYGVLYTGCNVSTNTDPQVHLATSPNLTDGGTWTKQGVVMPESTLGYYTEDPYVIEYGGSHWAFVEKRSGSSQLDIVLLESTDDGDSWVEVADPILANSTDSSFDTQDTSSPTLILLGSRLYMLYEGRSSGDNGQIGLAYSDNGPEGPWTKFNNGVNQADPVLSKTGWYANSIVPDDIFELNGDYYLLCHGQAGGSYKMGLFKTSDDQLDAGVGGSRWRGDHRR